MKLRKRINEGRRVFEAYKQAIVDMIGFDPLSKPFVYYAHPISCASHAHVPTLAANTLNKKGRIRRSSVCYNMLQHFLPNHLLGKKLRMVHPAIHLNGEILIEEVGLTTEQLVNLDLFLASVSSLLLLNCSVPSYGAFCEALAASKENVPVVAVSPYDMFSMFLPEMINTCSQVVVTSNEMFNNLRDDAPTDENNDECGCCAHGEAQPDVTVHEVDKSVHVSYGDDAPVAPIAAVVVVKTETTEEK